MASMIVEAIANEECGIEQIAVGFAGFVKLGDFVSDLFFISELQDAKELFQYDTVDNSNLGFSLSIETYIILASIFTAIGLFLDLFWTSYVVKEHLRKKKESRGMIERVMKEGFSGFVGSVKTFTNAFFLGDEQKDGWMWFWWNISLFVEEIPQLFVLIFFYSDYSRAIYSTEDQKDYMKKAYNSAIISGVFLGFTIGRVVIGRVLVLRARQKEKNKNIFNVTGMNLTSSSPADNKDAKNKKGIGILSSEMKKPGIVDIEMPTMPNLEKTKEAIEKVLPKKDKEKEVTASGNNVSVLSALQKKESNKDRMLPTFQTKQSTRAAKQSTRVGVGISAPNHKKKESKKKGTGVPLSSLRSTFRKGDDEAVGPVPFCGLSCSCATRTSSI